MRTGKTTVRAVGILMVVGVAGVGWGQQGAAEREAEVRAREEAMAKQQADAAAHAAKAAAEQRAVAEQAAQRAPAQLARIVPLEGVGFERVYFTMQVALGRFGAETVEIWGDGTCRYLRVQGDGKVHLITEHKLAAERVRRLSGLLAKTEWLTNKEGANRLVADGVAFTARVMRELRTGTSEAVAFMNTAEGAYKELALFILGIEHQEVLYERLTTADEQAFGELGRYLNGEKPAVEVDLGRYRERMVQVVRNPVDTEEWQVTTAVRAIGFYKATGERKAVEALAADRSSRVRAAVAEALAELDKVK
jgi:hypothetical protein